MLNKNQTNIENDFTLIAEHIRNISGIFLRDTDSYLLESKLNPLLLSSGCSNYNELYSLAKKDNSGILNKQIINAITTRETWFFRDKATFQLLEDKIFPDHFHGSCTDEEKQQTIYIWCAACSTGQEVYSIAILLKEFLKEKFSKDSVRLVGTDISSEAVTASQSATYGPFEMSRGLTLIQKDTYFKQKRGLWKVSDELTQAVHFVKSNIQEPHEELGLFDIIICKNVSIYFSEGGKKRLFNRLADQLRHKGILILSSMESLQEMGERFTLKNYEGGVYYEKVL